MTPTCPACGQKVWTAEQLTARGKKGAAARWGTPTNTGFGIAICAHCLQGVAAAVVVWVDTKPYHPDCIAPVDHEKKPIPVVPRLVVDEQVVRMTGHELRCQCLRCTFARTDLGGA